MIAKKTDPKPPLQKPYVPEEFVESALFQRFLDLVPEYALYELAPFRLAEAARRKGVADASPRDFACRCPVEITDGLPRCGEPHSGCRFAYRALTVDDFEKFERGADARFIEAKRIVVAEIAAFLKADDARRRATNARMTAAAGQRRRELRRRLTPRR